MVTEGVVVEPWALEGAGLMLLAVVGGVLDCRPLGGELEDLGDDLTRNG